MSLASLHRASAGAALLVTVLTVTAVLPAEWGIDPTGVGNALGLTRMGEMKRAFGSHPAGTDTRFIHREETFKLTLKPNQGTELKCEMRQGDTLDYAWSTPGTEVFYDFHGEPKGAAPEVYTSFEKATAAKADGTFEAPFEGTHGWFWKNRSSEALTIVVKTQGTYHSLSQR